MQALFQVNFSSTNDSTLSEQSLCQVNIASMNVRYNSDGVVEYRDFQYRYPIVIDLILKKLSFHIFPW